MRGKIIAGIRDLNPSVFTSLAILLSVILVTGLNLIFIGFNGGEIDPKIFLYITIAAILMPLVIAPVLINLFKHATALEQVNQQLQGQIEQHQRAQQVAEERVANLQTISDFALACAAAAPESDLPKLIADKLHAITGALGVSISEYDAREQALITRHVTVSGQILSTLNNLLGRNIIGLRSPISPSAYQRMFDEVVAVASDLNEVSFGAIPKPVSVLIQKTLGVGNFTGLAFIYGGELWGAAMLVMRTGQAPIDRELGLALANVAALAMRRQKTEEALQASEERYRLISKVSSDYMFSARLNEQGQMQLDWVAGAIESITGYTPDEYISIGNWVATLHPEEVDKVVRDMSALQENRPATTEARLLTKTGQVRWVRFYAHPVWDAALARLRGVYGAVQDIDVEKQASDRLQALNADLEKRVAERTASLEKALNELESFSYSISHDLRAPLRAVTGYAGILLAEHSQAVPAEVVEKLGAIKMNGQRMGQLVDGLLQFLRSGNLKIGKRLLNPVDQVQQVLKRLRPTCESRQVEFILETLPPCSASSQLLEQVYEELLRNAIKFTRQREIARIEIACLEREGETRYFVRDNGIGFDMNHAGKLFGVFQRLHHTEEFEGIGVGLAIARRIIERHGGRIWAESAVDQGATFYFTLEKAAVA